MRNLIYITLTGLLLVFSVHGIANARATLTIAPEHISGQPGDEQPITITVQDANGDPVSDVQVHFTLHDRSGFFSPTSDVTNAEGIAESLLTLPIRSATIFVRADANPTVLTSIDVKVVSIPHRLVKVSGDNQQNAPATRLRSPFVVRVEDVNNHALPGKWVTFSVVSGGGYLSTTTAQTNLDGEAETTLTLGALAGRNIVEVSIRDVPRMRFRATAAAIPEKLVVSSGADQIGVENQRLAAPVVVQVIDSNRHGVENVVVTFSITEGSGRLRPSRVRTDKDGFAQTDFTPKTPGTVSVEASANALSPLTFTVKVGEPPDKMLRISGDNQDGAPGSRLAKPFVVELRDVNAEPVVGITVTFAVTAGGGRVSGATDRTDANGRAQTYLTLGKTYGANSVKVSVPGVFRKATFSATSQAQVLIGAATHPAMYWIDTSTNTLHRLVGAKVENLVAGAENTTSLAVDTTNRLLYFGVKTGANRAEIRRSGLTGRNVETLKTMLTSVPMGIALDSAGDRLYWTTASGKIKRMATTGSTRATNVLQGLSDPTALTVSNGYLYWAASFGWIRRVNLTADEKGSVNIATGLGRPLSIAIAKDKIYWVEHFDGGGGRLQRANRNGTQVEELRAFRRDAPIGIAVDGSANKIYWTRATGKIQRANLAGRSVRDVVTGLMRPGAIVLGGTLPDAASVAKRTPPPTRTPLSPSKYDVNKDGRVDNTDASLVAEALCGTSPDNPHLDVNGDGAVNFLDLLLVFDNRDDSTAAPAINIDLTALDLDFDRVQEEIAVLLASGDTSLVGQQRALMYLQHLLASARPDATVLLANYPNPFNPETWIPYHLATRTDVGINIYNAQGIFVRALTLGHQSAGYYTSRSRAAYWDGRNALGERVASGVYFYQLETDEVSPMRKMVILK